MEQILTPARLRVLRHAKGMSQAQLARNLDIQRSYISQFENGKYILGDDVLRAMLESLGGYPDVADEIDESDGYTVQDLSSDTLKLRDDFLIPPGLDNNLVEDARYRNFMSKPTKHGCCLRRRCQSAGFLVSMRNRLI